MAGATTHHAEAGFKTVYCKATARVMWTTAGSTCRRLLPGSWSERYYECREERLEALGYLDHGARASIEYVRIFKPVVFLLSEWLETGTEDERAECCFGCRYTG